MILDLEMMLEWVSTLGSNGIGVNVFCMWEGCELWEKGARGKIVVA